MKKKLKKYLGCSLQKTKYCPDKKERLSLGSSKKSKRIFRCLNFFFLSPRRTQTREAKTLTPELTNKIMERKLKPLKTKRNKQNKRKGLLHSNHNSIYPAKFLTAILKYKHKCKKEKKEIIQIQKCCH